jgi:hypothetical protein
MIALKKAKNREANAIDDVRRTRAAISEGGFAALRRRLRRSRKEYDARTGHFAHLPPKRTRNGAQVIQMDERD